MVERASWAVDDRVGTLDARIALGSLLWPGTSSAMGKRGGIIPGPVSAMAVLATSPTPNGLVHIQPGHLVLPGTRSTAPYVCSNDAVVDINILSTPAHGTNARRDLIVAQQNDTLHSDANSNFTIRHVVGTPAASPSDPTVTGSPDYIVLARVTVAANATSINQAAITDLRPGATVAAGGILPVTGQTERDALTNPFDGMAIYRKDRDWVEMWDGSAWRVHGTAVASGSSDLTTAVTNPFTGQLAWRTDTHQVYRWTGSVWRRVAPSIGIQTATMPGSLTNYTTAASPHSVASITVSDPGYSYYLDVYAQLECGTTNSNTRWDVELRMTSPSGTPIGAPRPNISNGIQFSQVSAVSGVLSGTQTVHLAFYKVSGASADGQVTQFNGYMVARILPQPQV